MAKEDAWLTLEDVACVLQTGTDPQIPQETRERLARWVLATADRHPAFEKLRRLVRDAGLEPATAEEIREGVST